MALLFLAGILNRTLINNDWTNKATWTRVQKKDIPLPVTTNGDPDFDYMDKYIDNMKSKAKQNIQLMKSI